MQDNKINILKWPAIVGIGSLAITIFPVAYGVYSLNRIIITTIAVYYIYWIDQNIKKQDFWFWTLVFIAILFNPIIPIHLGIKAVWNLIDVAVIVFFIALINKFKK
jgi:hypothetical protein